MGLDFDDCRLLCKHSYINFWLPWWWAAPLESTVCLEQKSFCKLPPPKLRFGTVGSIFLPEFVPVLFLQVALVVARAVLLLQFPLQPRHVVGLAKLIRRLDASWQHGLDLAGRPVQLL